MSIFHFLLNIIITLLVSTTLTTAATINITLTVDILRYDPSSLPISFTTRAYNNKFTGPTIRVKAGDTLQITLVNNLLGKDNDGPNNWFRLPNTTNIHLHGLHISPSGTADDIFRQTSPGNTSLWIYHIPANHSPGTFWYHPHVHGSSSNQQGGGMAGALIIDPPDIDASNSISDASYTSSYYPPALAAMKEQILLFQHLCFHNEGKYKSSTPYINHLNVVKYGLDNVDPKFTNTKPSQLPDYYLVNGIYAPTIQLHPGEFQRFRMIGAGLNAFLALHVPVQCEMYMLAKDGVWVDSLAYLEKWLLLVPGGRLDVAMQCNETGIYTLASSSSTASPFQDSILESTVVYDGILLTLNVSGTKMNMKKPTTLPARASYLKDLRNISKKSIPATNQLDLNFLTKGGPFQPGLPFPIMQINGKSFVDQNTYIHNMTIDEMQEWTVGIQGDSNVGAGNHPFHQHVNAFQIISFGNGQTNMLGIRVGEYRDTIPLLASGSKVTIRFVPQQYVGKVLIHCHMIPHVDLGMAAVGQIVSAAAPSLALPLPLSLSPVSPVSPLPTPPPPPSLRIVHATFNNTRSGHYSLGKQIGLAQKRDIQTIFQNDQELASLVNYVTTNSTGIQIFTSLKKAAQNQFPMYVQEVWGMANGANVNNITMMVNQFREELVQTAPHLHKSQRKQGRGLCSSAFVHTSSSMLLGHNDDWTQNWRGQAYFIFGTMIDYIDSAGQTIRGDDTTRNIDSTTTFKFATWVYPGYLAGMDLSWNSHGMLYSVNSLFPIELPDRNGVGTAFVARDLLQAENMQDAIKRASNSNVATAMSYNLGSLKEKRLVELEVSIHGGQGLHEIKNETYFHGNLFIETKDVEQMKDPSTTARTQRWHEMQPVETLNEVRNFLGDVKGKWPVWRNHIAPDNCYTDVTGIFNLNEETFTVWTGNPENTEPVKQFNLLF